jgi:hypothetical protein
MREMLDSQNASEALAERVEGDRMAAFGMSETGADFAAFTENAAPRQGIDAEGSEVRHHITTEKHQRPNGAISLAVGF